MSDVTVFECNRGGVKPDLVKVQLDIPRRVLDEYKQKAGKKMNAKKMMENMLINWIDGVAQS